jgi:recombination protein RecA
MWLDAADRLLKNKHWMVWVNNEVPLSPLPMHHKGMDLGHFVSVDKPDSDKKLFCLLEELMSAGLFDLIGCDLGPRMLKEHQLRKLQAQARTTNTALVFLSQNQYRPQFLNGSLASLFSLILGFETKSITVERALHRPTPHHFTRSVSYARFTQHSSLASTPHFTAATASQQPEPRSLFEVAQGSAQAE